MKRLFAILAVTVCLPSLVAEDLPPNIVWIVVDDLGYGELGCQGAAADIPTPRMDSIAAEGVRFTQGYVTAPFCAASRAGLVTGRYQTRFGFEFNPIGPRNEEPGIGLPSSEETVAELLRDQAGYSTALVGKWHLGGTAPYHPQRHGYDEFFGFLNEGHSYRPPPYGGMTSWLRRKTLPGGGEGLWRSEDGRLYLTTRLGTHEPGYDADNPLLRNGQPVDERENLTDAFSREAAAFIRRCGAERPFFLHLAYNAVHSPMQADDAWMERFAAIKDPQRRIFAAMLAQLDAGVGEVLDAIDEAGLRQHTLVALISDNGGPTRELTSGNGILRGEKGSLYEGGIRVPFLVRFPGKVPSGLVYEKPILSLDLAATALSLAGVTRELRGDGVDLLPHLDDPAAGVPHESLYWRVGARGALRKGDWKIVGARGVWELYRLADDPAESQNLADTEPERLAELIQAYETLDAEMAAPLF